MIRAPSHHVAIATRCLSGVDAIALSSARTFPRHAHDQYGIGVMRAGGHKSWSCVGTVEAGPGDVIAVSPSEIHDGEPMSSPIGNARAWNMLYIDPDRIETFVGPEAAQREFGFAVQDAPLIARATLATIDALRAGETKAAEQCLTLLFADLLTPVEGAVGDQTPSPATLLVLERIHDTPETPPSLDEVAALMGLGRTGALRRFRREIGVTPHEHAMQHRLSLARRALARGEPPTTVALDLGFADQSHLTRAFGRQFGLSPGRYRSAGCPD